MKKFIKTMGRGIAKSICGAALSSGVYFAAVGFTTIPSMDGYLAVGRFAVSALLLASAFVLMWFFGRKREEDR